MAALVNIEGIGEAYAERMAEAKIGSTRKLLQVGATRAGRKKIAKLAGVTPRQVLNWVNRADLFRVRGIGEEYSDLLEASGVDSVPELAQRSAKSLHERLSATNDSKHLVRRVPSESEVARWIKEAKALPRVVEY